MEGLVSFAPIVLLLSAVTGLIWIIGRRPARNPPQIDSSLTVPEYKGPLAFFRRHYNGDYSLGRSYWVNTVLVSLFAPLVGLMLLPWLGGNLPARYGSAGFLFVTALGIVVWFWAISGTWASANKHVRRGGKSGWATAAKAMIVLGVLRTLGDVGQMMPVLQEHFAIASGAQPGEDTKLEIRAGGQSILLSGGINDGSAAELDRALQMAPSVGTVVLSSGGGWIREGKLLADVIRRHGVATYVEGRCESACTIAFLAGKDRAVEPLAKLGFHASRRAGSTALGPTSEDTEELRALYRGAGLPDLFVREALDTPHSEMWYPSHDVLLSAGVVTRRSVGGETASIATSVHSREHLSDEFRKIEMYRLLADLSPVDFDRLMEVAWSGMRRGATNAEIVAAVREELADIFPRFLLLARDETLIAYQSLMRAQLESLRARDVLACVEMAFPSGHPMLVVSHLPPALTQREMDLMADVLRDVDPARRVVPSEAALEQIAQQMAAGMTQDEILAISDDQARQRLPASLTCDAAIKFFAGLDSIPVRERGRALRILYAAGEPG